MPHPPKEREEKIMRDVDNMMKCVTVIALNGDNDMSEQMFKAYEFKIRTYFKDMMDEILDEKGMITIDPRTILAINCLKGKDLYMYVWRNVHAADTYENECYIEDFFI